MISLSLSTLLYIVVGLVMTGVVEYKYLNVSEAMSYVLLTKGHTFIAEIVSFGAILGIMAVVFAFIYAGSNIIKSMGRNQFLPSKLAQVNQATYSPNRAIWLVGSLAAILAGEFDLHYLALIANVGSLLVFLLTSVIVIVMRKKSPELERPFKIPGGATIPTLSVLICLILLVNISVTAWMSYVVWIAVGLIIYMLYTKKYAHVFDK